MGFRSNIKNHYLMDQNPTICRSSKVCPNAQTHVAQSSESSRVSGISWCLCSSPNGSALLLRELKQCQRGREMMGPSQPIVPPTSNSGETQPCPKDPRAGLTAVSSSHLLSCLLCYSCSSRTEVCSKSKQRAPLLPVGYDRRAPARNILSPAAWQCPNPEAPRALPWDPCFMLHSLWAHTVLWPDAAFF